MEILFLKDSGCQGEVSVIGTLVESEGPGPHGTTRVAAVC